MFTFKKYLFIRKIAVFVNRSFVNAFFKGFLSFFKTCFKGFISLFNEMEDLFRGVVSFKKGKAGVPTLLFKGNHRGVT